MILKLVMETWRRRVQLLFSTSSMIRLTNAQGKNLFALFTLISEVTCIGMRYSNGEEIMFYKLAFFLAI